MAVSKAYLEFIGEQLAALGHVTSRKMFGGAAVYVDGDIIALIADDVLFLKADETTQPDFISEGCGPFTYMTKDGEHSLNTYWRAPDRLFDDIDAMHDFARKALKASRRAATQKKPAAKSKSSKRK